MRRCAPSGHLLKWAPHIGHGPDAEVETTTARVEPSEIGQQPPQTSRCTHYSEGQAINVIVEIPPAAQGIILFLFCPYQR